MRPFPFVWGQEVNAPSVHFRSAIINAWPFRSKLINTHKRAHTNSTASFFNCHWLCSVISTHNAFFYFFSTRGQQHAFDSFLCGNDGIAIAVTVILVNPIWPLFTSTCRRSSVQHNARHPIYSTRWSYVSDFNSSFFIEWYLIKTLNISHKG